MRTLVAGLAKQASYPVAAVHIVANALMKMGWLYMGVPTKAATPLLDAIAGEAETVKTRLANFAAQNPHLHTRLVQDLAASVT